MAGLGWAEVAFFQMWLGWAEHSGSWLGELEAIIIGLADWAGMG
jgi:hypothetical protein